MVVLGGSGSVIDVFGRPDAQNPSPGHFGLSKLRFFIFRPESGFLVSGSVSRYLTVLSFLADDECWNGVDESNNIFYEQND